MSLKEVRSLGVSAPRKEMLDGLRICDHPGVLRDNELVGLTGMTELAVRRRTGVMLCGGRGKRRLK